MTTSKMNATTATPKALWDALEGLINARIDPTDEDLAEIMRLRHEYHAANAALGQEAPPASEWENDTTSGFIQHARRLRQHNETIWAMRVEVAAAERALYTIWGKPLTDTERLAAEENLREAIERHDRLIPTSEELARKYDEARKAFFADKG